MYVLAQMALDKIQGSGTPEFSGDFSYVTPWLIAAVIIAGILLVTFKTSRRNHLEKE
ncbi:MAG TPA: hypothetical protein VHM90_01635 [Phycisphaerae bacterium]|jgi:hypothetical protein|nr:hypothetical protein [Phycisphaerae bacterium]